MHSTQWFLISVSVCPSGRSIIVRKFLRYDTSNQISCTKTTKPLIYPNEARGFKFKWPNCGYCFPYIFSSHFHQSPIRNLHTFRTYPIYTSEHSLTSVPSSFALRDFLHSCWTSSSIIFFPLTITRQDWHSSVILCSIDRYLLVDEAFGCRSLKLVRSCFITCA